MDSTRLKSVTQGSGWQEAGACAAPGTSIGASSSQQLRSLSNARTAADAACAAAPAAARADW